ncbi:MAG TPA: metal-sensitive transcriptional regulator [Syntrophomonadaceae bacterium]|nr:metal-sensitive transcriptional regulator [Syntrophomonadaceae bacterium]
MKVVEAGQEQRENILLRLRRVEGQVRGIQRMIEEESSCGEILNQVAAVKSAIAQVGLLIFQNHARECIWTAMNQEDNEESFQEILSLMSRMMK